MKQNKQNIPHAFKRKLEEEVIGLEEKINHINSLDVPYAFKRQAIDRLSTSASLDNIVVNNVESFKLFINEKIKKIKNSFIETENKFYKTNKNLFEKGLISEEEFIQVENGCKERINDWLIMINKNINKKDKIINKYAKNILIKKQR